jgi:hypothetical protein
MEFRWVALIALWTLLSGPVLTDLWAKSLPQYQSAKVVAVRHPK